MESKEEFCTKLESIIEEMINAAMLERRQGFDAGNIYKVVYCQGTIDILADMFGLIAIERSKELKGEESKDETEKLSYR